MVRRMVSMTTHESMLLSPQRGDLVPLPEPVTPGMSVQNSWVLEVMLAGPEAKSARIFRRPQGKKGFLIEDFYIRQDHLTF